jgi:hypothetical protein
MKSVALLFLLCMCARPTVIVTLTNATHTAHPAEILDVFGSVENTESLNVSFLAISQAFGPPFFSDMTGIGIVPLLFQVPANSNSGERVLFRVPVDRFAPPFPATQFPIAFLFLDEQRQPIYSATQNFTLSVAQVPEPNFGWFVGLLIISALRGLCPKSSRFGATP